VVEEAIDGRLELVLAQPVVAELQRILISKLGFEINRWREVESLLTNIASDVISCPEEVPPAISGDPDDDLILACAVNASVDVLVSGDRRHILPIGSHEGVRIVTPQALLAELRRF
jgi:predicted nucleic acid-binding protein